MTKTQKILCVFLISYSFIYSQDFKGGKVSYLKKIDINLNDLKNNPKDKIIYDDTKNLIKDLESIKYFLVFNKKESTFSIEKTLKNDSDKGIKLAGVVGGGNGVFYTNFKNKIVLNQKQAFGSKFLIKESLDNINWELKRDVKLVGKYKCLKAVAKIVIYSRRGQEFQEIEAWYSPKIKFSTGPIGFGGLPGLILELKRGKFIYRYNDLQLNSMPQQIKKPINGKKISKEEFNKISKDLFNKRASITKD